MLDTDLEVLLASLTSAELGEFAEDTLFREAAVEGSELEDALEGAWCPRRCLIVEVSCTMVA
jgi:hypothetical protein